MPAGAQDSLVMRLLKAMEAGDVRPVAARDPVEAEVEALLTAVSPDLELFLAPGDEEKLQTPHACDLEPDRPCTGSRRCMRRGF